MRTDFAIAILAAGQGTRMRSRRAKVLHLAGGKTLVEWVVGTAVQLAAPERVFVVVGHQGERVREVVGRFGVQFVKQPQQRGTGHAVLVGRRRLARAAPRLLVLYGDCPLVGAGTLEALMRDHVASGAAATVLTTRLADPTGYGRILRSAAGDILAIVEHKAATPEQLAVQEINSGMYCFETSALFDCLSRLRPDNPAGEYYLTDVIGMLVVQALPVRGLTANEAVEVLGINTCVELAEVDALLRGRKNRELMLAGVTIRKPETVTIDAGVTVGPDSEIEPFAQILGRSSIGAGSRIGAGAVIRDSALSEEVVVEPFSLVEGSEVGSGARLGPYARLRQGSVVGSEARVGNFVELKQTRLGAGARASHLAYLGDATVGAGVNIGAGTITCNFDGFAKHPTVIEDGAFVGSNSTLVAPLTIGEGAYLAAGSVITEDVPSEALAIARGRQAIKPGWARKRRKRKN